METDPSTINAAYGFGGVLITAIGAFFVARNKTASDVIISTADGSVVADEATWKRVMQLQEWQGAQLATAVLRIDDLVSRLNIAEDRVDDAEGKARTADARVLELEKIVARLQSELAITRETMKHEIEARDRIIEKLKKNGKSNSVF